jgi:hypothetical protein
VPDNRPDQNLALATGATPTHHHTTGP